MFEKKQRPKQKISTVQTCRVNATPLCSGNSSLQPPHFPSQFFFQHAAFSVLLPQSMMSIQRQASHAIAPKFQNWGWPPNISAGFRRWHESIGNWHPHILLFLHSLHSLCSFHRFALRFGLCFGLWFFHNLATHCFFLPLACRPFHALFLNHFLKFVFGLLHAKVKLFAGRKDLVSEQGFVLQWFLFAFPLHMCFHHSHHRVKNSQHKGNRVGISCCLYPQSFRATHQHWLIEALQQHALLR